MHVSAVVLFSKMTERLSLVSHTLLICQTYIILRERDRQQQISMNNEPSMKFQYFACWRTLRPTLTAWAGFPYIYPRPTSFPYLMINLYIYNYHNIPTISIYRNLCVHIYINIFNYPEVDQHLPKSHPFHYIISPFIISVLLMRKFNFIYIYYSEYTKGTVDQVNPKSNN